MVSAVVVRSMALLLGLFSSWPRTSGSVSHRFDSMTRLTPPISGASAPNIWPATPWMPPGIGVASSRASAALMRPMALFCGGIDEWPGAVSSERKKVP
ncbi:hypothetical protein D3C87_1643530 [compost metagenome]